MRFVLDDDDRAFIALRRAVLAYADVRLRPDPYDLDEHPPGPPRIYAEHDMDTSGRLMIEPEGGKPYSVVCWEHVAVAAGLVDEARSALEMARIERDTVREDRKERRRTAGDPRKGRKLVVAPPEPKRDRWDGERGERLRALLGGRPG